MIVVTSVVLSSFVVVFVVFSSVVSFASVVVVDLTVVGFCVVLGLSGTLGLFLISVFSAGSVIRDFFVVSSNFVVAGFSVGGSSSGTFHG